MKKLLVIGMILLLTGCTIIIKPDCKCECPSNSWYEQPKGAVPFGDGWIVPNTYVLPTLESYEFKIK